jgi:AraC-like DNA-binding protein
MEQEIKILIAVLAKMNPGDVFKPHSHPYYQLNHIVQGTYEFGVDGYTFTAKVGDTILIPANEVHTFTQTSNEKGYYFEVKFSSFSKGVMQMCSDVGVFVKKDEFSGILLEKIFEEKNHATAESESVMLTYLYAILFKLTEKKRWEKHSSSKHIEVSAYSAPVRDVIRYLENNYSKRLTLDDIVAQTSLKKSYLCGLFKKETTVTIFECLMIIRVREAVELLTYNPLPLSQISRITGFVNITHFSRVFTKHVMISPGKFRKYLRDQNLNWNDATMGKKVNHITAATLEGKKIDFPQLLSEQ